MIEETSSIAEKGHPNSDQNPSPWFWNPIRRKMKQINEVLKDARVSLGLSEKDVCERTGLSIYEYGDLELYPDELFDTISTREAKRVCETLSVDFKSLIPRSQNHIFTNVEAHSIAELVSKTRETLGLSAGQLADRIGYESVVIEKIEEDEKHIEDLNISAVLELAKVLNVDPLRLIN